MWGGQVDLVTCVWGNVSRFILVADSRLQNECPLHDLAGSRTVKIDWKDVSTAKKKGIWFALAPWNQRLNHKEHWMSHTFSCVLPSSRNCVAGYLQQDSPFKLWIYTHQGSNTWWLDVSKAGAVYIRPFAIIPFLSENHFTDNNKITQQLSSESLHPVEAIQ